MWGRVYSTSRNALGMEQAKKMIAICTNTKHTTEDDLSIFLAVIEGET